MYNLVSLVTVMLATLSAPLVNVAMAAAQIDPALKPFFMKESQSGTAQVIALMAVESSQNVPRRYDRIAIPQYLRYVSARSWQNVERDLQQKNALGKSVKILKGYWINASFSALVTPEGLQALASVPQIQKIYLDRKIVFQRPNVSGPNVREQAVPYDVEDTKLDKVISEFPQVNGKGIVLGVMDTGADGKHEALAGKIISFFDSHNKKLVEPVDLQSHGTHVSGTIAGGSRSNPNNQFIGMAPEAKLQVAAGLDMTGDLYTNMLNAMEYFLDPDQNPATADQPRAINNSWHAPGAPDIELFYRAINAWEAAGILPVFAAGNSGCPTAGKTIGNPQTHPLAFAIGATGPGGKATSFSSCGPGIFQGKETQKPDITAPGAHIRSSIPGGRYTEMDGTSMAAPHVTGATGLLFQINPKLTPQQVREILMRTATPLKEDGTAGASGVWNRVYGFGKLNIYEAVKMAISSTRFQFNRLLGLSGGTDLFADPMALQARWILNNDSSELTFDLN